MAKLTAGQINTLIDRGLSIEEIRVLAEQRGDTIPEGIIGAIAKPLFRASARVGQAIGTGIVGLAEKTGFAPKGTLDKALKETEKPSALNLGPLGVSLIPGQKPLDGGGRGQILGQALEAGAMVAPLGRVASPVLQSLMVAPKIAKPTGFLAEATGLGYGAETGYGLAEGEGRVALAPGLGTAIGAGVGSLPILGRIASPLMKGAINKYVGIKPETLETILTRPHDLDDAAKKEISRLSVAEQFEKRLTSLAKDVSESGKKYDPIRRSSQTVNLGRDVVSDVLSKYGISVQDGKLLITAESPSLKQGDITALERFISQFGGEKKLTSNGFLNARMGLDQLADWGADKSDVPARIARDLRRIYDDLGKRQLKGLAEIDETFGPQKRSFERLRKEFLTKDEAGNWTLKDAVVGRLVNMEGKGKEKLAQRVDKVFPGFRQQVQLMKALEDISDASGNRAGQYVANIWQGGGLLGAGYAAATGNPLIGLAILIGTIVATPKIAVPILTRYAKIHNAVANKVASIISKLETGKELTAPELMVFRSALLEHAENIYPGNKFWSSPLGKSTADSFKNPSAGLSMKNVGGSRADEIRAGGMNADASASFSGEVSPARQAPKQPDVYKGEKNLTTKLLKDLEGRSTVSKQYLLDATNRPELKQAERDLFRRLLEDEGDTINVKEFANKVKTELLPLKRGDTVADNAEITAQIKQKGYHIEEDMDGSVNLIDKDGEMLGYDELPDDLRALLNRYMGGADHSSQIGNRYENINLPDELRGPVANYKEHIYHSPIKTSAGGVHFSDDTNNYFAHTRIEDLPTSEAQINPAKGGRFNNLGNWDNQYSKEPTRRVIEIQSDLFQKGRLEMELPYKGFRKGENIEKTTREVNERVANGTMSRKEADEFIEMEKKAYEKLAPRDKELDKLEPYRNTWHERVIREEIKQAAKDGKTKLQFPTGETAMKIEGLGTQGDRAWHYRPNPENDMIDRVLTPADLTVGREVAQAGGQSWIITDVLGDGKFKAVPKDHYVDADAYMVAPDSDDAALIAGDVENLQLYTETFDISGSGKVPEHLTNRYDKQIGKYLQSKYGAKRIKDAQGVEWYEIDVDKKMAKAPVEAFAVAPLLLGEDEE